VAFGLKDLIGFNIAKLADRAIDWANEICFADATCAFF